MGAVVGTVTLLRITTYCDVRLLTTAYYGIIRVIRVIRLIRITRLIRIVSKTRIRRLIRISPGVTSGVHQVSPVPNSHGLNNYNNNISLDIVI